MPSLLLRDNTSASLTALVESARKNIYPLQEFDLRLNNSELEFISLRSSNRKINSTSTDEGFESDIDTSSIVSLDNDSFNVEKGTKSDCKPNENDSANGSDTEALESGSFEKNQDEVDGSSAPPCPNQNIEKFNLVDCMCYSDIKCNDILIFVIKKETFVFKFDDINDLRKFYSKFTALKAVANQKNFDGKIDQNISSFPQQNTDIIHFSLKKKNDYPLTIRSSSKFMSISNPLEATREHNKQKESMSDIKYNTLGSSLGSGTKIYPKSSSILDSLSLDVKQSNLVKENNLKVWNSAEDILDSPKRPQRKKKRKAPEPPALTKEKQDIMSGQYVRVNVNLDSLDSLDSNRIGGKSYSNDAPKKNFSSIFTTKPSIKSLVKPKEKEILKYEHNIGDNYMLNRNAKTLSRSWNSSKFVGIPKTKPEYQQFIPVDYRHIDLSKTRHHSTFHNLHKGFVRAVYPDLGQNVAIKNNFKDEVPVQNISGRLFGLSSKLKDYSGSEGGKKGLWGGHSKKDMTLKSVIKGNKEEVNKKKKVTFSTYTTVQVV